MGLEEEDATASSASSSEASSRGGEADEDEEEALLWYATAEEDEVCWTCRLGRDELIGASSSDDDDVSPFCAATGAWLPLAAPFMTSSVFSAFGDELRLMGPSVACCASPLCISP